ncbi:cupin domain-containing protein [Kordia sp. YSTF-M3]|uniref:Cupin domain-containing protein n=1 Tax=Kordia aestuariivivens TaxID=2759037 RepID=A0ABR7QC91_9FLAO|nr:cupin domain-containing protein [Kordia aestuariivivens]MBC8756182.1 cupin domain-containing protein [Kordia aestuariivivens]
MNQEINKLVKSLELLPHPEGGFYKEVYRSEKLLSKETLPDDFSGDRSYCTSIYFVLTSENFSAFHRIKQDEIWHFYGGSTLSVHVIDSQGNYTEHKVGMDFSQGEQPQLVVPAGCWFASSVAKEDSYAFVGCTVAPGFDFDDFELAKRSELTALYPKHENIIHRLTRE